MRWSTAAACASLNLVDVFNREAMHIEVDTSTTSVGWRPSSANRSRSIAGPRYYTPIMARSFRPKLSSAGPGKRFWQYSTYSQGSRTRMPIVNDLTGRTGTNCSISTCLQRWMMRGKPRVDGCGNRTSSNHTVPWASGHQPKFDYDSSEPLLLNCLVDGEAHETTQKSSANPWIPIHTTSKYLTRRFPRLDIMNPWVYDAKAWFIRHLLRGNDVTSKLSCMESSAMLLRDRKSVLCCHFLRYGIYRENSR